MPQYTICGNLISADDQGSSRRATEVVAEFYTTIKGIETKAVVPLDRSLIVQLN